ncbi:transmembrane protein 69 [Sarcophilus harrisii]|uniref:Transmembrane protein 69 n=1 Tax=Sarcophilus harrisii TaxID=9305 RepID=G3VYD6_SARHA|nr:transmembrane protein 69 [Sarcophilus harrisii]
MLRLLRGCSRASSLVLKTPRVAGSPTVWVTPGLLTSSWQAEDGVRNYRTSSCCFKKKAPMFPSRPPLTLTYLQDTPKPALWVALTGLVPFVAPPLVMMAIKSYVPLLAFTQMAYGASFLSFLGGARWGFTLTEDSPAKPDFRNLACSGIPLVFSWYAFLISEGLPEALVLLILGFGISLHSEVFLLPQYPNWFKAMRIVVTLVAFFSFIATLIIKDLFPETGSKPGKAHSPGKL